MTWVFNFCEKDLSFRGLQRRRKKKTKDIKMPSWLKRRFQVLKRDLISHLVVVKSQKKIPLKESQQLCDSNNERIANNIKSPIQKIRNDLEIHRFRNKSDMNAYNDYEKWRDQVLMSQNNCALRCIKKEEKINNIDNTVNAEHFGATNQTECIDRLDNRLNQCNDKSASRDVYADDANCDSESEFENARFFLT